MNPDELQRVQAGRIAEHLRGYLESWYEKRVRKIRQRIFQKLDRGEPLSGELAVQAWIELHEMEKFDADLRRQMRVGRTAGEKLAPVMDGQATDTEGESG